MKNYLQNIGLAICLTAVIVLTEITKSNKPKLEEVLGALLGAIVGVFLIKWILCRLKGEDR